jgi:two-component system cell cycle sensor histidine kinase/response regulator CckA
MVVGLLGLGALALGKFVFDALPDWGDAFSGGLLIALCVAAFTHARMRKCSGQELRRRLAQQLAVARLGQLALTDGPWQELLDEASRAVAAGLVADLAGVLELLPDRSAFVLRAGVGWPEGDVGVMYVPAGVRSQGGFTLTSGEPVVMRDAAQEHRFELSPQMIAQQVTSGLSACIGSNGDTYGVLGAHTYGPRTFTEHDVTFLEAVCNVLAGSRSRRLAEADAEKSHRVLEAVVEGTSDDIFVKDLHGRLVVVNASAAETLGRPREELIGRTLREILPPDVATTIEENDRLILERGEVETFEEHVGARIVLATKGPYRARDGTLLGTFGIAHDITRRKEQEQALAQSEERLRLAQQGAQMGTWDVDLVHHGATWSEGLRMILGVGPDHPAGSEEFLAFVHPDDRERAASHIAAAFERGVGFEHECRIVRQCDGELRWLLARSSMIRDAGGALVRMLGVAVDITERKRAEDELIHSESERAELELRLSHAVKLEAVGQLAGGIAHDFNNLLVAIRGYSEVALGRLARGDDVSGDLREVLAASDRAAALTGQLLAFGRRQVMAPQALDLNVVVRETTGLLRRLLGDNVELVTTLTDAPVVVNADRGQLEQVITNLAVNGRDAMPRGGVLTIRVAAEGRSAILSVTDEGVGIDALTAAHIFEPFFTTKGEAGTGLGLATVHGVVAQSGGQIRVDSEPGHGATFTISLPLQPGTTTYVEAASAVVADDGTERILLVEDDPTVRSIVASLLAARGYDVVDVADGESGVSQFEREVRSIRLLVTDLTMRGLDGRETAARIRTIEPSTKVLFMSGYTDDPSIRAGVLEPGTAFIQKPFSGDELALRVRELLDAAA